MSQSGSRDDEAIQQSIGKRVKNKSIGQPDQLDGHLHLYKPATEGDEFTIDDDSKLLRNRKFRTKIRPEEETGNQEYTQKLIPATEERFQKLVSKLNYRLKQGCGEAVYLIGVEDDGTLSGINKVEMRKSMRTLSDMALALGASVSGFYEEPVSTDRIVREVFVRKISDDQNRIETRVAVIGNEDAGKTTLISVLTHGSLDDGSGTARVHLFQHNHEIESGNTSSITNEILGFDQEGEEIDYQSCWNEREICDGSAKIVQFTDLPGRKKYFHTMIHGITAYSPHYAMLVVNGTTGVNETEKEYLGLAYALELPVFVVITKIDLADHALKETLKHLEDLLQSSGKAPLRVEDENTVMTAGGVVDGQTVPIFAVSSVTGDQLSLLKKYLKVLSPLTAREREEMIQKPLEFHIYQIVRLSNGATVLEGLVRRGYLTEGSELLIGPFVDGEFRRARTSSIHRNRLPHKTVYAGQSASVVLDKDFDNLLRKGMVLLSPEAKPESTEYFSAEICVLCHPTKFCPGSETTVFTGSVRQTAVVKYIHNRNFLRTDDHASVVFYFKQYPEYIQPGSRLFFSNGSSKGFGKVNKTAKVIEDLKSEQSNFKGIVKS